MHSFFKYIIYVYKRNKLKPKGSVSLSVSEASSFKPVDLRCGRKYNDFIS